MEVKSITVKESINLINKGRLFLPPIQRNFVWDWWRINMFFDSVYHGYPLGTLIFWRMDKNTAAKYPLYQFIKEYWERQVRHNELASRNLFTNDVFGVVDGQQRLSSLFIGLAGVYHYKDGRIKQNDIAAAYQHCRLFVNLMRIGISTLDEDKESAFDFLEREDAENVTAGYVWYEVGKILSWNNQDDAEKVLAEIGEKVLASKKKSLTPKFKQRYSEILSGLKTLYRRLNEEKVIHYFELESQNIDEVVDIFVRVNSGGMQLKKHELLFSTMTAHWSEGRQEIEDLIEDLYKYNLEVDKGFVMRCCLYLSDLPVKYRLQSFNKKNIDKIIHNWTGIKSAIIKMAELLPFIGYQNIKSLSTNALIPIAYYIYNNGDYKKTKSRNNLKIYYVTSQVRGLFGGQGDAILIKLRDGIKAMLKKDNQFSFEYLKKLDLPDNKSYVIDKQFIENSMLKEHYGSPNAYYILSLLYPQVDFKTKRYQIDHIHPRSKFNYKNLQEVGIHGEEKIEQWKEIKCHELPNLQLLAGEDNNNKKSKTLIEYLDSKPKSERTQFMKENFLPTNDRKLLQLKNFDSFYLWRKKILQKKLISIFRVTNT